MAEGRSTVLAAQPQETSHRVRAPDTHPAGGIQQGGLNMLQRPSPGSTVWQRGVEAVEILRWER
jgi:hypothetical protein